jgi:hypothetical protein
VYAACAKDGCAIKYASEALKQDRIVALIAVEQDWRALGYLPWLWGDRELVMTGVAQAGEALRFATPDIQDDEGIVRMALSSDPSALRFASDRIVEIVLRDHEVILEAVANFGLALEWADDHHRADKTVVLSAVQQNGLALAYAHPSLQADRDVVLAAVYNFGTALEYADLSLRADDEVISVAVANDAAAWEWALSGTMAADWAWRRWKAADSEGGLSEPISGGRESSLHHRRSASPLRIVVPQLPPQRDFVHNGSPQDRSSPLQSERQEHSSSQRSPNEDRENNGSREYIDRFDEAFQITSQKDKQLTHNELGDELAQRYGSALALQLRSSYAP